jgi:exosortase/archaeosortase family protein
MSTLLLNRPMLLRLGMRIDRLPAGLWLVLLALALWPTAWWMGRRMLDGSDEPLGALAIAALAALLWHCRDRLRASPHLGWLALGLLGVVASSAALGQLPPLLAALLGLLALAAGIAAFLPRAIALVPVFGLALLSLPLLASLQFYLGYPLRVLTAEASRWLLASHFVVERSGAALTVDGRLVLVDAPCSGVQMLWLGYFTACVVTLYGSRRNASFLARLPVVSALVLCGNVLRNSLLVAAEGAGQPLPGWAHDLVGLLVLAAVCGAIAPVMWQPKKGHHV